MNFDLCPREEELLDAHGRGFVGAELKEHIAACPSCSELHLVAGALLDERSDAFSEAAVPSAGTMLWRVQMRRRREAQTHVRRTLLTGQALTLLAAVALAIVFFGADFEVAAREMIASIRLSTPMLLTLATFLLAAPIAGYVALKQK